MILFLGCNSAEDRRSIKEVLDLQVVAWNEGNIDQSATDTLRSKLRSNRGELPLFNYGPGIEMLRSNCVSETGLPAPVQPTWQTREVAA